MNNVIKRFRFPETIYKIDPKCPMATGSYYREQCVGVRLKLKDESADLDFKKVLVANSLFRLGQDLYA